MRFIHKHRQFDIEGVCSSDHILRQIETGGRFYENSLLDYMQLVVGDRTCSNSVAIDVGANIGNHSIYMRSYLVKYLLSVEPNPIILPVLRRNLSKNIDNFTIVDCAVGCSVGTGSILLPSGFDNLGMAKVILDEDEGIGDIQVSTLDSVVSGWGKGKDYFVTLIKVDVEGMEIDVLKGAKKLIRKFSPHIFCEASTVSEYKLVSEYLKQFGYRKVCKLGSTPMYHFMVKPKFLISLRGFFYSLFDIVSRGSCYLNFRFRDSI